MVDKLQNLTKKKKKLDKLKSQLPKNIFEKVDEMLMEELTYSSIALSGNSLTRQETHDILKKFYENKLTKKMVKSKV